MIPVIICGGVGTKMWPASRSTSPKQFLPLISGKSLFQWNWESLRKKFLPEQIYIQTTAEQVGVILQQEKEVLLKNIFVEPELRNQGPATGFAAAKLYSSYPDEPFMLVQVDDIRVPEEKFFDMMDVCGDLAKKTGKYITGGIRYNFGLMGVDYLIPGKLVSDAKKVKVYQVDKFLWRDTKEKAEEYVSKMGALVHTNHTCMTPRAFLEMFKKYKSEWYEPLMNIVNGGDEKKEYAKMPKGQIEEVTQLVHAAGESLVVELPFRWIDIGTWESTDRYLKEEGLYTQSDNVLEIDGKDNYIHVPEGKTVAVIGLSNVVVVDMGDAMLVCSKDKTGKVGEVVEKLKANGNEKVV